MNLYTARCPHCEKLKAVKMAETEEQRKKAQSDVRRWEKSGAIVKREDCGLGDIRYCIGGCQ